MKVLLDSIIRVRPTVVQVTNDLEQWAIDVLTAFGQMDHEQSKDRTEGVMTMSVKARRELMDSGWRLLKKTC